MPTTTTTSTAPTIPSTPFPRPRRRVTWRGVATGIGLVGAATAGLLSIGEKEATALAVGDCIGELPSGDLMTVRTVSCDAAHEALVVGTAVDVDSDAGAASICDEAFVGHLSDDPASPATGSIYRSDEGQVLCVVVGGGPSPQQP